MRGRHLMFSFAVLVLLVSMAGLFSCSGGGGDSTPPPEPPTYNVTGRWAITETITNHTGGDCTGAPSSIYWSAEMTQAQGSNTVSIRDLRASSAVNATMSGSKVTYSGDRYPEPQCDTMTASYTANLSDASHFTGTGNLTCNYNSSGGYCSVSTSLTGYKY